MNKEYLKEVFENNKDTLIDSECDIKSVDDLDNLICSYITTNMQYDFKIELDIDRLFNSENQLEQKHEEIEYDK